MDAMNSPANSLTKNNFESVLSQLKRDYPDIAFTQGESYYWSSELNTIFYAPDDDDPLWSLFHELGHMSHQHSEYRSDRRLLQMEVEAWDTGEQLAERYNIIIDEEHIEECLNSYRNWQRGRSKCPVCSLTGLERQARQYRCVNCRHEWYVSDNRFCRVYRMAEGAPPSQASIKKSPRL